MPKPTLFTDSEVAEFRAGVAEFREPGAYEEGRWNVSALNRRADVTGTLPETVVLRDISLRTMEQMPGVRRGAVERHEFLRRLVRTGVTDINVSGFVAPRTEDELRAEVDAARSVNPDVSLMYVGPVTKDDFRMVAAAGYDTVALLSSYLGAAMPAIVGQTYHRMWHGREWRSLGFAREPAEQIDRAVRGVATAKEFGLAVSAGMNMVAYASDGYIADYCGRVAEAGADEVSLLDSSSGMGPEAYGHVVAVAKEAVGDRCRVSVHAHDMFGLAVASGVAALKAGASVLEVSVNGYVLGPPQADLAVTAVGLEALYGVRTGIDLGQLVALSRAGVEYTGVPVAHNAPVVGPRLFALGEPDQYVEMTDVDPMLHASVHPALVGGRHELFVTGTTGNYGMWRKLDELGIDVEQEQVPPILRACLAFMETAHRLDDADIAGIARAVLAAGGVA